MKGRNLLSGLDKRRRTLALAALAVAAGGAAGCDDPFGLKATVATATDTLVAFAMTGTPPSYPAAFNAGTGAVVRVQSDVAFDVAFDLTSDNRVRLIPARLVSAIRQSLGLVSTTHQVGLLAPSSSFDAITQAPSSGYKRDSVLVVATNQPVVLEVVSDACQFSLASILYAKLVVDSVSSASRQIWFRTIRNPNCGFRSFQPGVPRN